jgi:hypothetical protein
MHTCTPKKLCDSVLCPQKPPRAPRSPPTGRKAPLNFPGPFTLQRLRLECAFPVRFHTLHDNKSSHSPTLPNRASHDAADVGIKSTYRPMRRMSAEETEVTEIWNKCAPPNLQRLFGTSVEQVPNRIVDFKGQQCTEIRLRARQMLGACVRPPVPAT